MPLQPLQPYFFMLLPTPALVLILTLTFVLGLHDILLQALELGIHTDKISTNGLHILLFLVDLGLEPELFVACEYIYNNETWGMNPMHTLIYHFFHMSAALSRPPGQQLKSLNPTVPVSPPHFLVVLEVP